MGSMHNVKSNLIWRKYGPWWLYRAIAINPGASRHTKTWSSRLVGIYRKIPNGSHAQTEPDRTIFPKVSISLLDLWLYGSYFAVNSGTKRLKHTFFHVAWLNEVPWWYAGRGNAKFLPVAQRQVLLRCGFRRRRRRRRLLLFAATDFALKVSLLSFWVTLTILVILITSICCNN